MEGREVQKILLENGVNLSWLAEKLGITPQGLNSRFKTKEFKQGYIMEINKILDQDLFGLTPDTEEPKQPILDIRVCAGNGIGLEEDENKITEYVSIPSFKDCKGLTVYGESMSPKYKPGDIIFVRPIFDKTDIDFGQTYLVITSSDRLLKSIYESKLGNDFLRLSSLNPQKNDFGDRLFPDRDIRGENILFLYKVVGSINREQI